MIGLARACRSCLQEGGEMKQLFSNRDDTVSEEHRLDEMLVSSTQIQISQNDGLPAQICLICSERLLNAFTFKKMCQESDITLKKHLRKASNTFLKNNSVNRPGIKQETSTDSDLIDFNELLNSDMGSIKMESNENTVTLYDTEDTKRTSRNNSTLCANNEKCTQTLKNDLLELHNCPECQKKFSSLKGLTNHLKKHNPCVPVNCNICNRIFFDDEQLKKHVSNTHKNNSVIEGTRKDFPCTFCERRFSELSLLQRHLRSHNKRQSSKCDNCDEVFDNVLAYEKHKCVIKRQDFVEHNERFDSELHDDFHESHTKDSDNSHNLNDSTFDDQIDIEYMKCEQNPVTIKEEPLEHILEEADRENQIITEEGSNSYLELDVLKGYISDADFDANKFDKKNFNKKPFKKKRKSKNMKITIHQLSCGICKKVFPSNLSLKKHQIVEHNPDELTNLCSVCNKIFDDLESLLKHELTHEIKEFECETCKKIFYRQDHLNKHMWQHMELKPFQCDMCSKGFFKQQHLDRHKVALHSGKEKNPKTAFCEICCRGFTTAKYLETHMRMHTGDKTFTCDVCDKSFNSKWHLKEHNRCHSAEKPFLCSECGQRFIRNDYLVIHMRRHKGEKPYKCKFCDKGFPRATDLTVHERYHTGEKTHLCTVCGKGFQRQYNLTVHLRVHTGEKPYVCSYCGKKFAQGNDLKSHVRRHTGERFNCDLCGEGFIQGYHLTQHKRTIHGVDCGSHIRRVEKLPQVSDNAVLQLALVSQNTKPNSMDSEVITNEQEHEIQVTDHEADRPLVPLVPLVMFSSVHSRT